MRSVVTLSRLVLSVMIMSLLVLTTHRAAHAQEGGASPMASPTPFSLDLMPTVTITAMPGYGPAPLMVGFFAAVSSPEQSPIVSYMWTFGDGNISTLPPMSVFNTYL